MGTKHQITMFYPVIRVVKHWNLPKMLYILSSMGWLIFCPIFIWGFGVTKGYKKGKIEQKWGQNTKLRLFSSYKGTEALEPS